MIHSRITLILACLIVLASFTCIRGNGDCPDSIVKPFDPRKHKPVYQVGVLAIRGFEAAYNEFNRTFVDYLTATVGQRYDPPISFELKPLNFISLFADTETANVDFIYVNPSAFSCIESEFTAHSLVSQVSRRNIQGNIYDLKKFGGVIAARADNPEIQSILDLKDKVIAAASISGLGSGQMQFLEMTHSGMSYINDPKQLVFTSNQGKVVKGVLSGEFDVGFIRTDQIERSKDADGNAIDPKLFRIIDPKQNLTIDGEPFPFTSSTALYPEWNIAALSHVAEDVSRELQTAMIALAEHAKVGAALLKCREQNINDASVICQDIVFSDDFQGNYTARCDTTPEVADIALDAMRKGKYAAWQTTLSYMQLRSMQEATGFISEDSDTGVWRCIRSAEIYDSISCPSGYYRKSREDVNVGCSRQALECGEGYQCLCSPCAPIKVCVDAVEFNGKCVAYSVFLPSLLVPFFVVSAILVYCYVEYKRKQSDSVWAVKTSQLKFDDPPKIVGIGTFGLVLLAEYRGTAVAVKRVIPASNKGSKEGKSWFDQTSTQSLGDTDRGEGDIENLGLKSMSPAMIVRALKYGPLTNSVGDRQQKNRLLKADFVREMRHLSKLRHPCITTVMGAVISRVEEPMLVMEYMNLGSLHDVLHNESIGLDIGEHILPILQDVAQGMRFLHAASPHQVVHGDLKAKNVLIDSNYRAKVTDFGLSSAKKRIEASGTPFWMAPELLRGESLNTSKSDMYAFGILIYEAYSRKTPYGGEEPDEVLKAIMHPAMNKRPPVPPNCSERMAEMMKECLVLNPNSRPTSEQVDLSLRVEGGVKERTTRLEELNRELAEANKKIASASAMQLEHFACMSHEIRTPLNCILGLSSLLKDSDLSESQADSMGMIVTSGKLLQCVVDDVLDYSKLESGSADVQIDTADLQEIVSDLINSMLSSTTATKRNITIRTFIEPGVSRTIDTDGRRLLQILFNLLSNAVKFSRSNGVVDFFLATDNNVVRFVVKDYGKGIARKEFESIFQPFTQSTTGIANIYGGTGLGLAITKKLVEALGGTISVDSRIAKWTEFTLDLPCNCPPICVESLSTRLKAARIYFVSSGETTLSDQMAAIFYRFNVPFTRFSSMNEIIQTEKSREASASDNSFVCMVQGDLVDRKAFDRACQNGKMQLISFGQDRVENASLHYNSLSTIFPSVLVHAIGDLIEGSEQYKSTKPVEQENTDREENAVTSPADTPAFPATLCSLKILIAEDNLVNQKVLKRLLNRIGVVNVEIVDNGKNAVDREAVEPFDMILMDMQMPVMDGTTACREILKRGDVGHPRPKIVFVTAHVSESFKEMCLAEGAVGYLPKPITVTSLKDTLEMYK